MRREVLDPANTCERCPHAVVALRTGTYWCPCEDCHPGGRIQGRVYTLRQRITKPTSLADGITAYAEAFAHPERLDATPEDDPLWVDPIHSLKETAQ